MCCEACVNLNVEWASEPQRETDLRPEVANAGFASVIMAESRSD